MKTVIFLLLFTTAASAQEPVNRWVDAVSYGTAAVNPVWGAVDALRSNDRRCHLTRLAISEGLGNSTVLLIKHFVVSPRPCLGCQPDGMPSGHTFNSAIGMSSHLSFGLGFTVATGALRMSAHRHTLSQVSVGAGVGILSEYASHLLRCQE